jgi:hypothetical protein
MTREDSVPVAGGYLASQVRRVGADGDVALRDALRTADRLRGAAEKIVTDVDRRDLAAVRARLRELVHLLPQEFAQLDDHLKEAEIVRHLAAEVGSWAKSEAAR